MVGWGNGCKWQGNGREDEFVWREFISSLDTKSSPPFFTPGSLKALSSSMPSKLISSAAFLLLLVILLIFSRSSTFDRIFVVNGTSRGAVCNDGSPAGYYLRSGSDISQWLLFLEGGGGCYSDAACEERWADSVYLMTSTKMTKILDLSTAIFSQSCDTNPAFCRANMAFFHYCSSDQWSGHSSSAAVGFDGSPKWHFRGRLNAKAIVEDLVAFHGLLARDVTQIVFAGSSAGGVGTWANADAVGKLLHQSDPHPDRDLDYRVMSDVGWFMEGQGLRSWPCNSSQECNVQKRWSEGSRYWPIAPQDACGKHYGAENAWRCLFGHLVYPFVSSTKMGFVYLFDSWQALQDGITHSHIAEFTSQEESWVLKRGAEVVDTFHADGVSSHGMMGFGCLDHGTLYGDAYARLKAIDGTHVFEGVRAFVKDRKIPYHVDSCSAVKCNPYCMRY